MSTKAIPGSRMRAQPREHVVGYQPRWYARAPLHVVIIVISVIWLLPTITLLFTSVRSIQDISTSIWWTLLWTPHQFTLENYSTVLHTATSIGMGQAFLNSLIITLPSTILPILIGAGAAYAFAWLRFPLRNTIFLVLVGLQIIPLQMLLIPLLRIFTSGIPYELLESGRVDGAGDVGIFARIILPLTTPAIAAVAIFQFMWVWNDLLVALVFSGPSTAPMTVIVRTLVGAYGNGWHLMTSAAFISMVLPLAIFFSLQRYFVTGLTAGAVKG